MQHMCPRKVHFESNISLEFLEGASFVTVNQILLSGECTLKYPSARAVKLLLSYHEIHKHFLFCASVMFTLTLFVGEKMLP